MLWEVIKTRSCTVRLTNLLSGTLILLTGSNSSDTCTYTQVLFHPVEGNNETKTHCPIFPFSCAVWGSCCAESCYSRWSPLFGNGPDHVTTKWWKLWAVVKLSISTDRLVAGNRQGTRKYIHALRRRRTEIPKPQQWWVDWSYSVKIKRREKEGYVHCFFSHSQQTGREREREREGLLLSSALWSCRSEAAAASSMGDVHNSCWWFYILKASTVCVCPCALFASVYV